MKRSHVAALIAAGILLGSCGTARRGVPLIGDREITDAVLLLGRQVFDANCHQCHVGGTAALGFALNDKPLPGWLIKFQVRNGLGAMPDFSEEQISSEELDALVEYMVWLRRLPPVTDPSERPERPGEP